MESCGNSDVLVTVYKTPGGNRWVFVWHPCQLNQLIRKAATYAANPDLDFSWRDLSVLYTDCLAAGDSERHSRGGKEPVSP